MARKAKIPAKTGLKPLADDHLTQLFIHRVGPGQFFAEAIFSVYGESGEEVSDHNGSPLRVRVDTKSDTPLNLASIGAQLVSDLRQKAIAKLGMEEEPGS